MNGLRRGAGDTARPGGRVRGWARTLLNLTSLRLRLVTVFALVALAAAVSVSGIAYWLNRDAVLTRAQDSALSDFSQALGDRAGALPDRPTCEALQIMATKVANRTFNYEVILEDDRITEEDCRAESDPDHFVHEMIPASLRDAVSDRREGEPEEDAHHLYWQRIKIDGDPYLIGGAQVIGGGPTGYLLASLAPERDDLNSLAVSLGVATALAVIGSVLLAQGAATMVLRPVQRLSNAARRLGEGKLDTRLAVRGADELAELTRTFNNAAASLEAQVEDLSERETASRRFVADMSHELRTPMTAITAMTELLEDEVETLDPRIAPAVQLVVSETRRLNDLVENLMEVTRFDAGTAKMVLDDVNIADQVTACIDARAWLDAVHLDADRSITARLDPRRLDVILANLIGNALKHGGSPVRVTVREHVSDDGDGNENGAGDGGRLVSVEVADQGPGIPEDVLPHVFDRFYKASASRPRSDGSGLGLSIALENAHLHGGDITVHNDPAGGAVFTLRLPHDPGLPEDRADDDPDTDQAPDGGRSPDGGQRAGGRGPLTTPRPRGSEEDRGGNGPRDDGPHADGGSGGSGGNSGDEAHDGTTDGTTEEDRR
ncbi:HAMP domain-containing protein [Streptomyces sp. 3MP-14]|uniref:histidine kinase n=1 Tax=Streptomyces mimosae TaxID=2586635 RepID=A0A5N6A8Z4_9ACTN|nr:MULTISPECIES: HAMP domain-containing sensor histidine kinase [Streptomyces]KAB8165287.1 HAMP domain-containing protein [Streptomyces mimosae]KAB8175919.1 HAMP domain-containing protein [Streptomyces sp. 3MP-14]